MNQISANKPIARGRTADVYEWDAGHVLKIFHDWFEVGNIEYEQRIARAVHASGVKCPAVGEIIQVDGHTGLIYERVAGESMAAMCLRKPWKALAYARVLARLHAQMHNCLFEADVPAQRNRIQSKINHAQALAAALKSRLLSLLDLLPEDKRVCHGDLHPENVLISEKESTVIDWIDASRGNPLADVARTTVILVGSAESKETSNLFLKLLIKIFHATYLKEYFRLRPGGENEYQRWIPIIAGARLSENIPEIEIWLIKQAQTVQ